MARKKQTGKKTSSSKSQTKKNTPVKNEELSEEETTKNSPKKESKDHKNGKNKSTQNTEPNSNGADLESSEETKNNEHSLLEDDDDKFLSQDTPKKVAALTPKTYEKKGRSRTLAPSPSAFTPYSLPTDTSPQKKKRRNVIDLKEAKDETEQDTSDSWFQGLVASIKTPTKKPKLENETKVCSGGSLIYITLGRKYQR